MEKKDPKNWFSINPPALKTAIPSLIHNLEAEINTLIDNYVKDILTPYASSSVAKPLFLGLTSEGILIDTYIGLREFPYDALTDWELYLTSIKKLATSNQE